MITELEHNLNDNSITGVEYVDIHSYMNNRDLMNYAIQNCLSEDGSCKKEQIKQIRGRGAYSIIPETLHAYFHSIRKRKLDLREAM